MLLLVADARPVMFAENVFKNFFKESATSGKLKVPSVLPSDAIPLIAGTDVAGAAAGVLLDFDAYAGQAHAPLLLPPLTCMHGSGCMQLALQCSSAKNSSGCMQPALQRALLQDEAGTCDWWLALMASMVMAGH
jgi:hypothetical protein